MEDFREHVILALLSNPRFADAVGSSSGYIEDVMRTLKELADAIVKQNIEQDPNPDIYELGLSTRATRILREKLKCAKLSDVKGLLRQDIESASECGETTQHEIFSRLAELGIRLPRSRVPEA